MMNYIVTIYTVMALAATVCLAQPPDTVGNIIWFPPIQLSDSNHNAAQARIALSGDDTVHVTWWEDVPPGIKLPYVRSVNSGQTFEHVREMLPDSLTFPNHAFRPLVVAEGNKVFVFFVYSTSVPPFNTPLRMIRSSDYGISWSDVLSVSPDSTGDLDEATNYSNTLVLIYPPDARRKILRSTDNGLTWTRTNEDLDDYARIALTEGSLKVRKCHAIEITTRKVITVMNLIYRVHITNCIYVNI